MEHHSILISSELRSLNLIILKLKIWIFKFFCPSSLFGVRQSPWDASRSLGHPVPVPVAWQVYSWAGCPASKPWDVLLSYFMGMWWGPLCRVGRCHLPDWLWTTPLFQPCCPLGSQLCISTRGCGLLIKELAGEEGRGKGFWQICRSLSHKRNNERQRAPFASVSFTAKPKFLLNNCVWKKPGQHGGVWPCRSAPGPAAAAPQQGTGWPILAVEKCFRNYFWSELALKITAG